MAFHTTHQSALALQVDLPWSPSSAAILASHSVAHLFIFAVQVNLPGSPSAAATLASYAAHQFASMDQQVTAVQGINALAVACGAFTAERIAFASCLPLAPGGGFSAEASGQFPLCRLAVQWHVITS